MKVAVLGGGRSSEHEVSLASAAAVRDGLSEAGHEPLEILVERDGSWWHGGEEIPLAAGRGLLGADVVFPALHGPFGEDGTVQGLLECLEVPYVGAGVLASAVCMDKVLFKDLLAQAGLPQVAYHGVTVEAWRVNPAAVLEVLEPLGLPVFVKPARLGSSVGIVRVADAEDLRPALDTAFRHDPRVIVEAAATGLEVECSVKGNGAPEASPPGEIVLRAGAGWYDYEAKYSPGGMELVVPPRVSEAAQEQVRLLAVRTFLLAGCAGLARVDFFVDGEEVLVNELNTMPGFTPTSVYAKLWEAGGVPYPALLGELVALALERFEAERSFTY